MSTLEDDSISRHHISKNKAATRQNWRAQLSAVNIFNQNQPSLPNTELLHKRTYQQPSSVVYKKTKSIFLRGQKNRARYSKLLSEQQATKVRLKRDMTSRFQRYVAQYVDGAEGTGSGSKGDEAASGRKREGTEQKAPGASHFRKSRASSLEARPDSGSAPTKRQLAEAPTQKRLHISQLSGEQVLESYEQEPRVSQDGGKYSRGLLITRNRGPYGGSIASQVWTDQQISGRVALIKPDEANSRLIPHANGAIAAINIGISSSTNQDAKTEAQTTAIPQKGGQPSGRLPHDERSNRKQKLEAVDGFHSKLSNNNQSAANLHLWMNQSEAPGAFARHATHASYQSLQPLARDRQLLDLPAHSRSQLSNVPTQAKLQMGSGVMEQGMNLAQYIDAKKYMSTGTSSSRLYHLQKSESQVEKMQNNIRKSIVNAQRHDNQRKKKTESRVQGKGAAKDSGLAEVRHQSSLAYHSMSLQQNQEMRRDDIAQKYSLSNIRIPMVKRPRDALQRREFSDASDDGLPRSQERITGSFNPNIGKKMRSEATASGLGSMRQNQQQPAGSNENKTKLPSVLNLYSDNEKAAIQMRSHKNSKQKATPKLRVKDKILGAVTKKMLSNQSQGVLKPFQHVQAVDAGPSNESDLADEEEYDEMMARLKTLTDPQLDVVEHFLMDNRGTEINPVSPGKSRATSLQHPHSHTYKKNKSEMRLPPSSTPLKQEGTTSEPTDGLDDAARKDVLHNYQFQKLKFQISEHEQEHLKALKVKEILTRKNLNKMGGADGAGPTLVAKTKLIRELDGKTSSRKDLISLERENKSLSDLEESSYDKRIMYEKKRQFREFQKDQLSQERRQGNTDRSQGSTKGNSKLEKTLNTMDSIKDVGMLGEFQLHQQNAASDLKDIPQIDHSRLQQYPSALESEADTTRQRQEQPDQLDSSNQLGAKVNSSSLDDLSDHIQQDLSARPIMEIFIDKYNMEEYQNQKKEKQEMQKRRPSKSPLSASNLSTPEGPDRAGPNLQMQATEKRDSTERARQEQLARHKQALKLLDQGQQIGPTPKQQEEMLKQEYEKTLSPKNLKKMTGMPEQSVKMFDRSSRLSDSATDRRIEKELQNSIQRAGSIDELQAGGIGYDSPSSQVDLTNINNADFGDDSNDISPLLRQQASSKSLLWQQQQPLGHSASTSNMTAADEAINSLVQYELLQKQSGKQKKQLIQKVPIADRRRITQERLKIGKKREYEQVQQFVKDFNEKHLKIRDEQREELVGRKSPGVWPKQDFQKLRDLANKYTINKKEWVLNSIEEVPASPESTTKSLPPETAVRGKGSFHRQPLQLNPASTILKIEDQSASFGVTEESKIIYLRKKQMRLEKKRDKQYKKILNIFQQSKKRRKMMRRRRLRSELEGEVLQTSPEKTAASKDLANTAAPSETLEPTLDALVKQDTTITESSKPSTVMMPLSDIFEKEDDQHEAMEYNGVELPEEYLLAKLSFTNDHLKFFKTIQLEHSQKQDLRRNTDFNFAKPDVFNDSQASIHEVIESDTPSQEVDEGLNNILQDFQKKTEFLKVVKYNNRNQNRELTDSKKLHHTFVESTTKYMDVPLPILLKIRQGTLFVPSVYSITEGVSMAIMASLRSLDGLDESKLCKAIFQKNGMNDLIFSNVLKGLRARPEFTSLVSVSNEIGDHSAQQICCLLERENDAPEMKFIKKMPEINELRLISSKCTPRAMDKIIESISRSVHLKKLSLQNMNLSERQLKVLFEFIRDSTLQVIDISWNKLTSGLLALLLQALEFNVTVENLDLSFIQMGPGAAHEEVLEKNFDKFCNFLKENQKLVHLNLTSCNLPEKYMLDLICNLKRSQSLHCVHLCGNQFTEEAVDLMNSKLKPTEINGVVNDPGRRKHKNALLARIQRDVSSENTKKQYEKIYGSIKMKDLMLEWLSVQQEYQHSTQEDENFMPLILSKQLGHPEIRNSKHWKINNECYMCDKWKYTYIFWDLKNTGDLYQIKNPFLEEMIEEMIQNSNERLSDLMQENKLGDSARAFISGSFTDWQPRRMYQIEEILALLQGRNDVFKSKESMREYSALVKNQWKRMLKKLTPYKNDGTQWVNFPDEFMFTTASPPEVDYNQLFVYCDFIKPGKHQYIVTYENMVVEDEPVSERSASPKMNNRSFTTAKPKKKKQPKPPFEPHVQKTMVTSYHEFLSTAFISNYNINTKINEFDSIERKFDKNKSVFKDWKLDRTKAIQEGFRDEISYWNVPNFVKDEEEQQKIANFLTENCEFLKTYFIIHSSASYFPVIRWLYYAPMVTDWNIFDQQFKVSEVDRIFIAVKNIKQELRGKVSENDMSRFQFYESLVRIAQFKYKNPAITETVYDGVVKLVNEVLLPKYNNYIWMGWRVDNLWTLEVDDLYKTNLKAMEKLYRYFFKARKKTTFHMEDAIDMFTHEVQLDLLPEQITQCWGLSKMTVNNDIKQRDQYFRVTFVEFLEFFARMSELKFKDGPHKNESLVEKICLLMDLVFPIVAAKRKEVKIEIEYVSVSEEELDENRYFM